MNVLTIDVGGTHIKILATKQTSAREVASGSTMTAKHMVESVKNLVGDWTYDAVSLGYPGLVVHGRPVQEPHNLGPGWVGFNFADAFKCPVKVINDAAMQALGDYRRGNMLFLGLGTGLGSAMVVEGLVVPMELAHLPYKKGTYEDYAGIRGLKKHGLKRWTLHVIDVIERLKTALEPSDTVIGGGNVKKLHKLPRGCRASENANAFIGGFRLWTQGGRRRGVAPKANLASRSTPSVRKQLHRGASTIHPGD